ncbi:MAG: transglutaminase, partial [Polyangiaceae bacterium]
TWDRPGTSDGRDQKVYRTDYLFAPPDVFGMDHLPDDAEWQLRVPSMEKSEFFRQPMLSPSFRAKELVLVSPDRAQVTAGPSIDIELKNPRKIALLPDVGLIGSPNRQPCEAAVGAMSRIHCSFPSDGVYIVRFFSETEKPGTYGYDGQLEVNSHR